MTLEGNISKSDISTALVYIIYITKKVAYVSSKIWVQKQENRQKWDRKIKIKIKWKHIFLKSLCGNKLKIKGPQIIRFNNNNKNFMM